MSRIMALEQLASLPYRWFRVADGMGWSAASADGSTGGAVEGRVATGTSVVPPVRPTKVPPKGQVVSSRPATRPPTEAATFSEVFRPWAGKSHPSWVGSSADGRCLRSHQRGLLQHSHARRTGYERDSRTAPIRHHGCRSRPWTAAIVQEPPPMLPPDAPRARPPEVQAQPNTRFGRDMVQSCAAAPVWGRPEPRRSGRRSWTSTRTPSTGRSARTASSASGSSSRARRTAKQSKLSRLGEQRPLGAKLPTTPSTQHARATLFGCREFLSMPPGRSTTPVAHG